MSFPRCLLQLMGERSQVPQYSLKPKTIRAVFQWLTENDVCEFESSLSLSGMSGSKKFGPRFRYLADQMSAEFRWMCNVVGA